MIKVAGLSGRSLSVALVAGALALGGSAEAKTLCAAGTYSSTGYAPCTPASPGYYVSTVGSTVQHADPHNTYTPTSGATAPLACPSGGQTNGAAPACRAATEASINHTTLVGPVYSATIGAETTSTGVTTPTVTNNVVQSNIGTPFTVINLGDIEPNTLASVEFTISNTSTDLSSFVSANATQAAEVATLTELTTPLTYWQTSSGSLATGFTFGSISSTTGFSAPGFPSTPLTPIYEGQSLSFSVDFEASTSGTYDALYTIFTDEGAVPDTSSNGVKYRYEFIATAVPEPATWTMMLVGFAAVAYRVRRIDTRAA